MHLESLNNAFRDVVLRVKIHVYSKMVYVTVTIMKLRSLQSTQVVHLLTYILVFLFSYSSAISKVQEQ